MEYKSNISGKKNAENNRRNHKIQNGHCSNFGNEMEKVKQKKIRIILQKILKRRKTRTTCLWFHNDASDIVLNIKDRRIIKYMLEKLSAEGKMD